MVLITLALIFYSTGIERIVRLLKPWHVNSLWAGFVFAISGTLAMHKMAEGLENRDCTFQ